MRSGRRVVVLTTSCSIRRSRGLHKYTAWPLSLAAVAGCVHGPNDRGVGPDLHDFKLRCGIDWEGGHQEQAHVTIAGRADDA